MPDKPMSPPVTRHLLPLPIEVIEEGLEHAKDRSLFGKNLDDMTPVELLACNGIGWAKLHQAHLRIAELDLKNAEHKLYTDPGVVTPWLWLVLFVWSLCMVSLGVYKLMDPQSTGVQMLAAVFMMLVFITLSAGVGSMATGAVNRAASRKKAEEDLSPRNGL